MPYTPTHRFFVGMFMLLVLSLGGFLNPVFFWLWGGLILGVGVIVVVDGVWLSQSSLEVRQIHWSCMPTLEREVQLALDVRQVGFAGIRYQAQAVETDIMAVSQLTAEIHSSADGSVSLRWPLTPKRRGEYMWPGPVVCYHSRLGLLQKWQVLAPISVSVYPRLLLDIRQTLNPDFMLEQMGVKLNHRRRAEQEFESLRPYVQGDNYRHIDWKASSRMNALITRQFQLEQHHQILICLDISRMMGTQTDGVSKLDWAIEAVLHLTHLASRFHDKVGLLVFSNEVHYWIKPLKHPVEAVLKQTYNLSCQRVEADYRHVCTTILTSQKKRSLIIFLTDFLDAASLEPAINAFGYLNRKHCSLFIGIEDPAYHRYLEDLPVETSLALAQTLVAQDSMKHRMAVVQQLNRIGLKALSVTPQNLVQQAVNAYFEIRFGGGI